MSIDNFINATTSDEFSSYPSLSFLCPFIFWSLINIPFLLYIDLIPSTLACWFTNDHFAQVTCYFLVPFLYTIFPLIVLLTYQNIRSITHFQWQQVEFRQRKWEKLMRRMIIIQTVFSILCSKTSQNL